MPPGENRLLRTSPRSWDCALIGPKHEENDPKVINPKKASKKKFKNLD